MGKRKASSMFAKPCPQCGEWTVQAGFPRYEALWTREPESQHVPLPGPAPKFLQIAETATGKVRTFSIPGGMKPVDQSRRRRGLAKRRAIH